MKLKHIPLLGFLQIALFCQISAYSQSIVFAKKFTETGEGIDKRNIWYADSSESRVAIIYNNGKETINAHRLVAEIKGPNDSIQKFILKVGSNKNWVADYFEMKQVGRYAVLVLDEKGNVLSTANLYLRGQEVKQKIKREERIVKLEDSPKPQVVPNLKKDESEPVAVAETKTSESNPEDKKEDNTVYEVANAELTLQFEQCNLVFCEAYKDGKTQNPGTTFKLNGNGKYVELVLTNDKGFGTDLLLVDVWKKKEDDTNFNDHFDSKEVKIDKKQATVVFHYSFRKPGEYKISIFTKDNVWITSGYVTIIK